MGSVVDELIIKLGLDTKGMEDNASKAEDYILGIDAAVKKLGGSLDALDFSKIGGKLGKTKPLPVSGTPMKQTANEAGPNATKQGNVVGEKEGSGTELKKALSVNREKEEATNKKRDKQIQSNTEKTTSGLSGVTETLGKVAAGLYIFKTVADFMGKAFTAVSNFTADSLSVVNAGKFSGIDPQVIQTLEKTAYAMGYDAKAASASAQQLITNVPVLPGQQYDKLLTILGVATRGAEGEMLSSEEILQNVSNQLSDLVSSRAGTDTKKQDVFLSQLATQTGYSFEFLKQMSRGWETFENVKQGMIEAGTVNTAEEIERNANVNKAGRAVGSWLEKIGVEAVSAVSPMFVPSKAQQVSIQPPMSNSGSTTNTINLYGIGTQNPRGTVNGVPSKVNVNNNIMNAQ